jgi:hypothetical protein
MDGVMPNIAMTFWFLDATNQPRKWAAADEAVINNLGLKNLDKRNPQRITGQRVVRTIPAAKQCGPWTEEFDLLIAAYEIFSDAAGAMAVGRDAPPCIGSLIAGTAVTLYLKTRPASAAIGPAIVVAVAAPGVTALATQQEISDYLGTQTYLRVYIPASLSRGHQATTCLIIRRLIALGYGGAFEVIYENANGNAGTIQILLPELNLGVTGEAINPGNYQSAALGNCVFTFTTVAAGPLAPPRQFGISGGVDNSNTDPRPICNVSYFLMLQPFQWNAANYLYVNNPATPTAPNPIDLGNQALLGRLRFLGTTCYWTDTTAYPWDTASAWIPQMPAETQPVVTDIQAFCCADGATKRLLPVYGLAQGEGGMLSNWPTVRQITALTNLVLAVLNGQASAPLNQGTVILTLDSYASNWAESLKERLPANYQARLRFWAMGDPWVNTSITSLAANQILIVNLPRILPVPLFNYFYLKSSLPPVFEGKGTMPIMLNSGRPYLQLSKQANGFDTVQAVTAAAPLQSSKVFLFPSLPYTFSANATGTIETETVNPQAQICFDAEKAVVWNNQANVTITAAAFPRLDAAGFNAVRDYLQTNFYIDGNNLVQNKFKALLNPTDFESLNFPAVITRIDLYTALQTACGAGPANVCTLYRNNIALLTAFLSTAITATPLQAYFTGLGTYFNTVANDKLLPGMGFAVAAIRANL